MELKQPYYVTLKHDFYCGACPCSLTVLIHPSSDVLPDGSGQGPISPFVVFCNYDKCPQYGVKMVLEVERRTLPATRVR